MRVPDLIDYQDEAYARRYAEVVKRVVAAEAKAVPGQSGLSEAAARYLYKLMAWDEFEVARLHAGSAFLASLDALQTRLHGQVQPRSAAHLKRDPVSGDLQKEAYGAWMLGAFRWMTRFKGPAWRRARHLWQDRGAQSRAPVDRDYVKLLDDICARLDTANHGAAIALASVPRTRSAAMATSGKERAAGEGGAEQAARGLLLPAAGGGRGAAEHGRGEGLGRQRGQQGRRRRS